MEHRSIGRNASSGMNEPAVDRAMDDYARGDAPAFRTLYEALYPRMFAYLLRLTGARSLAEDLVQETFLRIHRARATFAPGASAVAWAYAIARNVCCDHARAARVRGAPPLSEPEGPLTGAVVAADAESAAIAAESARIVDDALARLPTSQREAFVLLRYEGLSLEHAAAVLGTTASAVKLRAFRAYEALRAALRSEPAVAVAARRARRAEPAVTAPRRARSGTRGGSIMHRSNDHVKRSLLRAVSTASLLALTACLGAGCEGMDTETDSVGEAESALENGTVITPTGVFAGIGRVQSSDGSCTGTLISNWAVLTAAHCVTTGQPATFILTGGRGSIDGTAVQHPLFNDLHWNGYDYAVIRFPHSIFDDAGVDSTGLVPFPVSDDTIQPGTPVDWYGMGNYGNDCEDFTSLTVTRYQGVAFTSIQDDWQYVLSSTTKGTCGGDSGGPMISNGAVVGVHSWKSGNSESYTKPTYMVYTWIRENAGRPELPGDTWGHCVYYPTGIGAAYYSTQGNAPAFTGGWDNTISSVWVEKGYRATLFDGTSYGGAQLGSYNGFLGAVGNCNEFGCFYDLAGTSADNKASSAKCESELPGDTWGYCVLYQRYNNGYLSTQNNLSSFDAYPEWNNSAAQIWVKLGRHAQVFPFEGYQGGTPDPNGVIPYWSSVTLDGSTGDYCNGYGCLHDLTGTVGERTASSIKCW